MAWISARLDRLRQIVAECIKRDLTPNKIGFADFINRKVAEFGLRPQTAREYCVTLGRAWDYNKWISYVRHNDYLSREEQERWIKQISKKS